MKLSERQQKCLQYLGEEYEIDEGGGYRIFSDIAEKTGLPTNKVRCAVRALARKGLAQYDKLFTEEGMIAGSGYRATKEGALLIKPCVECKIKVACEFGCKCWSCEMKENKPTPTGIEFGNN